MTLTQKKRKQLSWSENFKRFIGTFKIGSFKGKNKKFSNKGACHKCGSTNHFIKECPVWKNDKTKERNKETKAPFPKANVRKAMIATWGDSETEEEVDQQNGETAKSNCLLENADIMEDEENVEVRQHILESDVDGKTRTEIYDLIYDAILECRDERDKT